MSMLHSLHEGHGPLLLLLHGIGSSATAWSKQIERLSSDFSCLAPDLPGYGASPDPAAPGLQAIVADIAALLADRPAHVVGVSFGALCALGQASLESVRPHRPILRGPPCAVCAPNVCNCTWHLSSGADLTSLTLDEVSGTCRGRIALER